MRGFLKIDGSFGEGGGQIVRTAITLSCLTKTPLILENIRKSRKIPGLRPQHITAIRILQQICNAKTEGVEIGSTRFKFVPDVIKEINLKENVGTAGSITLILQVLIPIAIICQKKIELLINGGTDVLWSPTMDYTRYVLREAYARLGIDFSIELIRRGYYPKGEGEVKLEVFPSKIKPLSLIKRETMNLKLFCTFSKLPIKTLEKKIEKIKRRLIDKGFSVTVVIKKEDAYDIGSSILITNMSNNSIIGYDGIYDKKINEFNIDLNKIIKNNLGVDENLSDMLVLPASLTSKITVFRVPIISKHLETNLFVTSKLTGCKYGIGKLEDGYEIRIKGISYPSIK